MTGQQDRDPPQLLVVAEKLLDIVLSDHVEPDGGFVQEEHLRRVQQGGDQLHLHPLAQRQLADRLRQQFPHVQQFHQLVPRPFELIRIDAIDVLVQAKRFGGRQVPPELILLPHDQGKTAAVGIFPQPGDMPHHPRRSAGRVDHAAQQLQRRRLAGAIGTQKRHEFAFFHLQVDAADRLDLPVATSEQATRRGQQAFLLLVNPVRLRQTLNFNNSHTRLDYKPASKASLADRRFADARRSSSNTLPGDRKPW